MIVGLTGGIGSGKTTVANMFKALGVPVYIADKEAKKLMVNSTEIKSEVIALLGQASYNPDASLNRNFISEQVFNSPEKLEALNQIVHPRVGIHFKAWVKSQTGNYVIKEAAILFENDGYKKCDKTILVTAPEEVRVERVLQRDNSSREAVLARMNNQWPDSKKIPLADYHLQNVNLEETKAQVKLLHAKLSALKI